MRQERQFAYFWDQSQSSDAHTQSQLVQAVIQHLQISQDQLSVSIQDEMNIRLAKIDYKIAQRHVSTSSGKGPSPLENTISTFRRPPLDLGDPHSNDSDGFSP
jgi:hypothetical protein